MSNCKLGHLNKEQCKNFQSHLKFLMEMNLDGLVLTDKERAYIEHQRTLSTTDREVHEDN
jgi:hypothetical protein